MISSILKLCSKYIAFGIFVLYNNKLFFLQIYSCKDVQSHITKTKDILSDSNNDWEKRVESVSIRNYMTLVIMLFTELDL